MSRLKTVSFGRISEAAAQVRVAESSQAEKKSRCFNTEGALFFVTQ
jgi:hypothetical protein